METSDDLKSKKKVPNTKWIEKVGLYLLTDTSSISNLRLSSLLIYEWMNVILFPIDLQAPRKKMELIIQTIKASLSKSIVISKYNYFKGISLKMCIKMQPVPDQSKQNSLIENWNGEN